MLSELGLVDVSPLLFISANQPLFGHDLERLKNGCVAGRSGFVEGLLDLADGARAALPQPPQNPKPGIGRAGRSLFWHSHPPLPFFQGKSYYEEFRSVNENLRSGLR